MLFIICGNGFAYAQTFNEMPIPAFTLHKEMKTPQIFCEWDCLRDGRIY